MLAVIGDIHSNLEALTAVLDDIKAHHVEKIICVGDVIGFGPDPCACLDLVMECCQMTILGNHDEAAFIEPAGFSPVALQAVDWTRKQLEKASEGRQRRWEYLGTIPRKFEEGDVLFVHGSPREPTHEYIFPEDIYNHRKMDQVFSRFSKYCVMGHTHLPGILTVDYRFISPEECGYRYLLGGERTMINVGSVGQPRDGDLRACYVLLDDDKVIFRRIEYDAETTMKKLRGI
ncbi:MAG TPA: metallophosphoesterase family protein [Pirellulaceae bacterium]|nr:metallophosphoesterase family protein [Pirellulaceae bacterium]